MVSQDKDERDRTTSYKEAISWLYSLQKLGIKFGLSKTSNLLEAFGNPHRGRKYIHIAGTNGKGSVGVMLESILMESGMKVGFYSSPHLVSFEERFRINRAPITRDNATTLIQELRGFIGRKEPPTFFELTTAMALIYFSRSQVDVGIIEVGMGGRLDATNVITPMVSVITNIGPDHKEFLGNTIIDIAKEKAGIIKENVDVVTAVDQPSVARLFEAWCTRKAAPCWRVGHDVNYRRLSSGLLNYYGLSKSYKNLKLGLKGRFQYRNSALALLVAEIVQKRWVTVPEEAVRAGLAGTVWPGRLEQVSSNPTIILDGAHNSFAMRSLAQSMRRDYDFRHLVLVLGVMGDKDISNIAKEIVPLASRVIYTRSTSYRAADPHQVMDKAKRFGKAGEARSTVPEAIERARSLADARDLILITGSLYIVGEAESFFNPVQYPRQDI